MHPIIELRKMDIKTLIKELDKARYDLNKIYLSVTAGKEKANHKVRKAKRFVAHINTVIHELKFKEIKQWDLKKA